jgi:hypothetical protein
MWSWHLASLAKTYCLRPITTDNEFREKLAIRAKKPISSVDAFAFLFSPLAHFHRREKECCLHLASRDRYLFVLHPSKKDISRGRLFFQRIGDGRMPKRETVGGLRNREREREGGRERDRERERERKREREREKERERERKRERDRIVPPILLLRLLLPTTFTKYRFMHRVRKSFSKWLLLPRFLVGQTGLEGEISANNFYIDKKEKGPSFHLSIYGFETGLFSLYT